ncbi:MAG: transcriptional repressor [Thermoplasmata archaeon]|nr:MAG: transcriptional repressor [Thermoplasmata archaeon]
MEKYAKLLKKHGIKVTPQRLEILKYLNENHNHPTAFQIFSNLKERNPSFSKTTVYNTLEMLKAHKLIQVLTISESELRYEFDNKLHHHFLCKKCGKISDIDVQCPFFEKMLDSEYKVEEVHGYFKGICTRCSKEEELKSET